MSLLFFLLPAAQAEELAELRERYIQKFAELADTCDQLTRERDDADLTRQAEITRRWCIRRDPGRQYIFVPGKPEPAPTAPKIVAQWHSAFMKVRAAYADGLFEQAKQAQASGRTTQAYQLLHEVLRHNPDHVIAEKMLAPAATGPSIVVRRGTERIKLLDWSARRYWRVETPHFEIITNVTRADDARSIGGRLEDHYAVWQQIFFDYWSDGAKPAFDFEAQTAPQLAAAKQHQVVVFADRQQYITRMNSLGRVSTDSEGIYNDDREQSFFYARDELGVASWYHETTHQLFQETGKVAPGNQINIHMWIIEGIAIYMESLQAHDGYFTVGGFDAPRMQYARYRRLNDGYYVPLRELTSFDRDKLNNHDDIRRLYTQAGGLAHFLMDDKSGRYRRAAVDLLKAVYTDRDNFDMLPALAGAGFEELDAQYVDFLAVSDDDLAQHLSPADRVVKLSLGHTAVTDKGLAHLVNCTNLEWLDLENTAVTDTGMAHLKAAVKLNRLNLKKTAVGDASLAMIGRFRQLDDLNLAHTKITSNGLGQLAQLDKLTAIWLEGTAIDDASLSYLPRLSKLEFLDLAATPITDELLSRVARLKSLRALYLSHTAVTDTGLEQLKSLKNLELLQVDGTKVTSAAVARLREILSRNNGDDRINIID